MEKNSKETDLANVSETLLQNTNGKINKGPTFGVRHFQLILFFIMIVVGYLTRVMMSVAIVAMTDPKSNSNSEIPVYNWTNKSIILSAFFCGYVLPQIFAGWLANKYGPKWFLILTTAIGSTAGFAIPMAAKYCGSSGVIACRIFQGIAQGFVYPSCHYLLSQWTPLSERSRSGFFVYGGSQIGTMATLFVSGLLASSSYGWPMIFYTFSFAGLAWCVLFAIFGHNSPKEHPKITEEEKNYILSSTGVVAQKKKRTPWLKMFTSVPVWALILTQCGYVWMYDLMLTQLPNYMNKVLNFDIKKSTMLAPLPYLTFWILCLILSLFSDMSINKKIFTIGVSRKIFSSIGFIIPAIAIYFLGSCDSSQPILGFVLLIIAVGGSAAGRCGFFVNQLDIAPNHAGTLMGIVNGISNIFGVLATVTCHFIVTDETDPSQWKIVFYMTTGINIIACLIFVFFGSGEVQPWNNTDNPERSTKRDDLLEARRFSTE